MMSILTCWLLIHREYSEKGFHSSICCNLLIVVFDLQKCEKLSKKKALKIVFQIKALEQYSNSFLSFLPWDVKSNSHVSFSFVFMTHPQAIYSIVIAGLNLISFSIRILIKILC